MLKLAFKNIRFLNFVLQIPVVRYFFILRADQNFNKIVNDRVLDKFYNDIYVGNKTSKRTFKNRFTLINHFCLKYLNSNDFINIHDVAVSNGISSCELFDLLDSKNLYFRLYVSDKYACFHTKNGLISRFYDSQNQFTFGYIGPFFACDKNIFFPFTILLFYVLKLFEKPAKYDFSMLLFHPDLVEKINQKKIQYIDYDIFVTKTDMKFDFIRCMNILNLGYFNENKLIMAIRNISASLNENGILLIGRTNLKGQNNATFFRKKNGQLIAVDDFNYGSELKQLISQIKLK